MLICMKCQKDFRTIASLSSHLSYPNSACKTNSKEYYDTFIRKPTEGICIYCGIETAFYGLAKGYQSNRCQKCHNRGIEVNLKRSNSLKRTLGKKSLLKSYIVKLIEVLRKRTIDQKNKRQCQICGLIFDSEDYITKHIKIHNISLKNYYDAFFKSENENICLCYSDVNTCQKNTRFISFEKGYSGYCSVRCVSLSSLVYKDKEQTSIKKYGVSHPLKNKDIHDKQLLGIKKAIEERGPSILEKRKRTNLERYGFEFVSQVEIIKRKQKNSFIDFKKTSEYKESRLKMYNSYLETTFYPSLKMTLEDQGFELIEEYKGSHLLHKFKCKKCGSIFEYLWNTMQQGISCKACNGYKSKAEIELTNWVKTFNLEFIENDRFQIAPYELDIFFPSKNLAIEYCGLYYHSELVNTKNPKVYHKNKLNLCREKNIRLIQIFEDEWLFKTDIVKNRIQYILGLSNNNRLHSRKCVIKEIDSKEKDIFLEKNHIQGRDTSSIKLGAFYNNELVSVMTFSKGRLSKGVNHRYGVWELNRFSSDYNFIIPGIASKLLEYFKRNYFWKEIFSYADLRWSQGDVYKTLGFDLLYETTPGYWYFKDYTRIHRFNLKKKANEPRDIPEWVLRHAQGFYRIWDCGHLKFGIVNQNS